MIQSVSLYLPQQYSYRYAVGVFFNSHWKINYNEPQKHIDIFIKSSIL